MKLVLGIDFDDTIVKDSYPFIGKPKFMAIPVLKWLAKRHTLVLWTCRSGRPLEDAVRWCSANDLEFDFINANTFDRIRQYNADCRKLSCDVLVDDTAGYVFWPWVALRIQLLHFMQQLRGRRRNG